MSVSVTERRRLVSSESQKKRGTGGGGRERDVCIEREMQVAQQRRKLYPSITSSTG